MASFPSYSLATSVMTTTNSLPVAVIPDHSDNGQDAYKLTRRVQEYAVRAVQCHGSYHRIRQIMRNADAAIRALDKFSQSL